MILNSGLSASKACNAVSLSKPTFYRWKKNDALPDPDIHLRPIIHDIALHFPKYGYRRITHDLHRKGFVVNHKRVLRIMKEDNLLCIRKKFRPITTQSNHGHKIYPNLVLNMEITRINQVWVSDITYIRLLREFVYLAVILDLFSRKCIGWKLSRSIDAVLTLGSLEMAIAGRRQHGFGGLIHHSDQGVQYAAASYAERLMGEGIKISMSRRGNVYDNAFAESFMKTLKAEEVEMNEYGTFEDAQTNIGWFIDEVYNKKRLHSSIGYKPPVEFEQEALNRSLT